MRHSGMKDPALAQLVDALRASGIDFAGDHAKARADFETTLATIPVADDLIFAETSLAGLPALRVTPPGARMDAALLYLHGGAYIAGSAGGYRALAAELARAAGVTGYALDYRLAPEAPFPAAVEDAVAACRALVDQGIAPGNIVIAGDSAGGGLALAALLKLRDDGAAMPAAALLISPWADLRCNAPSYTSKETDDPSLDGAGLRASAAHYLAGAPVDDPLASPVLADLAGLPPLLVQVGSSEILLDDALAVAVAAGHANVAVRLEVWPHMMHVFHAFGFMLADGRRAISAAGDFLSAALDGQEAGR